jgi:uncharacterized damage-inducible protein DinB
MTKHALLPEFDHEMATTRALLDRVPDDALGWKPHEKSRTLGELAGHLARLPSWAARITGGDRADLETARAEATPAPPANRTELLQWFDDTCAAARTAIDELPDEGWRQPWTLRKEGRVMFTMPRQSVIRTFVLSHLIHHRGQLSVYLRLREVPLPPIYGPTADQD